MSAHPVHIHLFFLNLFWLSLNKKKIKNNKFDTLFSVKLAKNHTSGCVENLVFFNINRFSFKKTNEKSKIFLF